MLIRMPKCCCTASWLQIHSMHCKLQSGLINALVIWQIQRILVCMLITHRCLFLQFSPLTFIFMKLEDSINFFQIHIQHKVHKQPCSSKTVKKHESIMTMHPWRPYWWSSLWTPPVKLPCNTYHYFGLHLQIKFKVNM